MTLTSEQLSAYFEFDKHGVRRCLAPGMACQSRAIASHSLQNSRVLEILARDGHVKALGKRFEKGRGPVIEFEDIGRNQATTFTGLCAEHDSTIFNPIDIGIFGPADSQHLFLAAYRAVLKELHSSVEAMVKIQASYQERVRLGLDSGNEPLPTGMLAVEHMMKSYLTNEYKLRFDQALVSAQYDSVLHDVVRISHDGPTVAVCSLFSVDGVSMCDDWVRVVLNVLSLESNESIVIFSYLPADAALGRASLDPILSSGGLQQKYFLSKQILNSCQNFVVSPSHYDRWSPEKRRAITEYFIETLFKGNLDRENELLYLF